MMILATKGGRCGVSFGALWNMKSLVCLRMSATASAACTKVANRIAGIAGQLPCKSKQQMQACKQSMACVLTFCAILTLESTTSALLRALAVGRHLTGHQLCSAYRVQRHILFRRDDVVVWVLLKMWGPLLHAFHNAFVEFFCKQNRQSLSSLAKLTQRRFLDIFMAPLSQFSDSCVSPARCSTVSTSTSNHALEMGKIIKEVALPGCRSSTSNTRYYAMQSYADSLK